MLTKKKVFILTDWFVPGYKAGGPITSVYTMCKVLAASNDVYVLTNNHDWHEPELYDLPFDNWLAHGEFKVWYAASMSLAKTVRLLNQVNPDYVYLNGIYSPQFHALPLLWYLLIGRKRNSAKWIVAPRGMLNPNAIALKSFKKKTLIKAYDLMGIASKVLFHATSNQEEQAIKSIWHLADVRVLSNLPSIQQGDFEIIGNKKRKGFVSVGRISPVKNTHRLIELFSALNYPLTIIGTHDDEEYFRKCSGMIKDKGLIKIIPGLAPDALAREMMSYRFFVSLTSGENFGHAIIEAMSMGCPVLISDTTPWNDIPSAKAGWVITLSQKTTWLACLKEAYEFDEDMYNVYSTNARNYVKAKFDHVQIKNAYLNLFND